MTNDAATVRFLGARFHLRRLDEVLATLSPRRPGDDFRYVVTPNADHVTRLAREPDLAPFYESAWQSWNDSHVLRRIGWLFGLRLPHLNGTDVTEAIFARVIRPGDRIALIVSRPEVIERLRLVRPDLDIVGHVPPFGFVTHGEAFAAAVRFGAGNGARFLFIGVGAPQSEKLAHAIASEAGARGTAFCIGSAIEFIGGLKARAPKTMQSLGLEWLHRLLTEPRRLWRRYVGGVLPLAGLVVRQATGRLK